MAELIARSEWTMDRTAQEFASVATTAEETQQLLSIYAILAEASNCGNRVAIIQQCLSDNIVNILKGKQIKAVPVQPCAIPGRIWDLRW